MTALRRNWRCCCACPRRPEASLPLNAIDPRTTAGPAPGAEASLDEWLRYIESRHDKSIDMGLDRVSAVARKLSLTPAFPILTVGGTNGKGSTCAMLESILDRAGYRVGCYTSPHLLTYNERVRVGRRQAEDSTLTEAFAAVEAARGDVSLTYFEFGTLAAMWHFLRAGVDVAVLEVGLGGRLDAVNVFDADVAVITSIGIDHIEYLGPTRESIGFEKAGILRSARPAVIGDPDPPHTIDEHASRIGALQIRNGIEFRALREDTQWRYEGPGGMRSGLPYPALRGHYQLDNAAAAITALDCLKDRVPVASGAVREGLLTVELPGRFQVLPGRPVTVLDVAHNPHAAQRFASALEQMESFHKTHAVFAMLHDKDIVGVVRAVKPHVDRWYLAPLEGPRGTDVATLSRALDDAGAYDEVLSFGSVAEALSEAKSAARADDRILVFGSFLTVAQAFESDALRIRR